MAIALSYDLRFPTSATAIVAAALINDAEFDTAFRSLLDTELQLRGHEQTVLGGDGTQPSQSSSPAESISMSIVTSNEPVE